MLAWAFKASVSQSRIILWLTLSLPEFTKRKGGGGPTKAQWGQGDLKEVKGVQGASIHHGGEGIVDQLSWKVMPVCGRGCFPSGKTESNEQGRKEMGLGHQSWSLGTYFPSLGPTPKVSTTIQSSATIWRTSIQNESLWEAFYIQTINSEVYFMWLISS